MQGIDVQVGDITAFAGDAIVNAANNSLLGGGGVDGAIHRGAGPELLAECRELNGCSTGDAKVSKGYNLPAQWVVHTVGPIWKGGNKNEAELLASAYLSSLKLAYEKGARTIAFPNISTGAYGFPKIKAAEIAIDTVKIFLKDHQDMKVTFMCFSEDAAEIYKNILG